MIYIQLSRLINYDTAQLAKEKGFEGVTEKYWCNYYINFPYTKWKILKRDEITLSEYVFPCPTQSELQTWLRVKHGIQVYAYSNTRNMNNEFIDWVYTIHAKDDYINLDPRNGFSTYEQAMEVALIESLKLI